MEEFITAMNHVNDEFMGLILEHKLNLVGEPFQFAVITKECDGELIHKLVMIPPRLPSSEELLLGVEMGEKKGEEKAILFPFSTLREQTYALPTCVSVSILSLRS